IALIVFALVAGHKGARDVCPDWASACAVRSPASAVRSPASAVRSPASAVWHAPPTLVAGQRPTVSR
ncbi:MAG: hypothetical protein ACRDOH_35490, partial [Streptosporangiaceae bacterium]